jgi:hypothetical protein
MTQTTTDEAELVAAHGAVPFWHRCGYHPLWTMWHARPASTLG